MKQVIKLSESQLKKLVSESVKRTINEWPWGNKKQTKMTNQNNKEPEIWNIITQARELLISLNEKGLLSKYHEEGEDMGLRDKRSRLKLDIADAISKLENALMIFKELGYKKGKVWDSDRYAIKPYV